MPSPNHRSSRSLSLAGTGAALRRGDISISDPIPQDPDEAYVGTEMVAHTRYLSAPPANDPSWTPKTDAAQWDSHYRHVSAGNAVSNPSARVSTGPSLMPSSMSSAPSKSSLTPKKASGFRATIKRMFSSKRHRSVPNTVGETQYLRSDPGHLNPVVEQAPAVEVTQPHALTAPAQSTALGSHSTHYQSQSVDIQPAEPLFPRGRRNTLPSLVFSDKDTSMDVAAGERSAQQSRQDHHWSKEDHVSEGQFRRRSRSADALNQLVKQAETDSATSRNRASEIAFWRTSAIQNPVPVYSGQSIAVDPVHVPQPTESIDDYNPPSSNFNPLGSFDFGLEQDNDGTGISLEQRVNTLEIKLFDFEYALAKLQGVDIPKPVLPPHGDNRRSIIQEFTSNPPHPVSSSPSSHAFGFPSSPDTSHDATFLSSPDPSSQASPTQGDKFPSQRTSKATTATIRPSNTREKSPRPSSPQSIHIPVEKFEALLDIVKQEQEARRKLEEQVLEMQQELDALRSPVYATIREAYPTPSPESSHAAVSTPRLLHRAPAFQIGLVKEISRFSNTETDSNVDDVDDVDGFEDVYETPQGRKNTFETARGDSSELTR
ncbi:hypothetical protein PV10_01222 [Exophiala mesophila]|uniref:Uncharacterized protein n=1 Tax=Exophiala mesophila TaxID=212818 RepID=A0A0D1YA36_EXOME|nr:uncharacterized protein PV10_01222 [Exophiala mesophila]KIV97471.1 hypothetical protein PV10_01222 [Exophiala mesophila]